MEVDILTEIKVPISVFDGKYTTNWEEAFASRTHKMASSIIRELLKFTVHPDVISFAGGLPAPELFPIREVREACEYILAHYGPASLQYGPTEGHPELRRLLAEKMQKYGVPAEEENILITTGSQQALDLVGKVFIDPGDYILTTEPTYVGAIQAWSAYGARFLTVPMDDDGILIEPMEKLLQKYKVKFIYVLPNFHNPAGVTISEERRHKIIELAARYGTFIVEDDPYGELRFEGQDLVPLITLHKENVIYLCTLSKTLAPGLRIGWVTAPSRVINKLVLAKQGADLHTATFPQFIAADILGRGLLKEHVRKIRRVYKERRDVMIQAMEEFFPEGITWTRPQGGLFLWVTMPEKVDSEKLLERAKEEKVAFVPGFAFYPNGGGRNCMRLNFSNQPPDRIREGIRRLANAIKAELRS